MIILSNKLHRAARASGFTIVEMMIAMAVGSVIMIGAITMHERMSRAFFFNESLAGMTQTGSAVLDIMARHIRRAGFAGTMQDPNLVRGSKGDAAEVEVDYFEPCYDGFHVNMDSPVEGFNNVTSAHPYWLDGCLFENDDVFDSVDFGSGVASTKHALGDYGQVVEGSDVLIIRHAGEEIDRADITQESLYLHTGFNYGNLFNGDNDNASLLELPLMAQLQPDDPIYPYETVMYRLWNHTRADKSFADQSEWVPGLYAHYYTNGLASQYGPSDSWGMHTQALPFIEDLQVQFALDTNGDDLPDRYVNPEDPAIATASDIFAVKVWLRLRSTHEVGNQAGTTYEYADQSFTSTDDYLRVVVSRTIGVRNGMARNIITS